MTSVKQTLLQLVIVVALAMSAFANILDNGFVYDDHLQILDNPWLRSPRHLLDIFTQEVWGFTDFSASDYYRPLMHSLNLFIYSLFGPNRIAFHAGSLFLHIGNCVLFYFVCRSLIADERLLGETGTKINLPLIATALFAVYPANTEAVAWLGSTADLLYVFFCLAALLCWMQMRSLHETIQLKPLIFTLLFFFAATLSKETAFLFPLLLVVVDTALGRFVSGGLWARLRCGYLPIFGVALLSLIIRFKVLGAVSPITHSITVDVPALVSAFAWYLSHLLWPFHHNFYPELPTLSNSGLVAVIIVPMIVFGVSIALVFKFRRSHLMWIALALVVLPLMPALANSSLGMPVAERYLYFPGMGFCLFLAWAVNRSLADKRLRYLAVGSLLLVFAVFSHVRNTQFQNDLTIWGDTIQKSPGSAKAMGWYATGLLARGRLTEGINQTLQAIELGLKSSNSLNDLARAMQQSGREEEIDRVFRRVLDLHPDDPEAFLEVGRTYAQIGHHDKAIPLLEHALALKADYPLALIILGRELAGRGEPDRALLLFEQAIELDVNAYPALKDEILGLSQQVKEN